MEFKNFLVQFKNCVDAGGKLGNSVKLTYLRSYLTGYAYKIISHLSITDDNYEVALSLLKDKFLDTEFIVDEYFRQIVNNAPKYDPKFDSVKKYLNETRAALHELKTYNINLLERDTPGFKLVSHIIFDKLPNVFKRELVHKVDSNFPTIEDLLDNFNAIIKTLVRTKNQKETEAKKPNVTYSNSSKSSSWKPRKQDVESKEKPSALDNFATSTEVRFCKFCSTTGHSMFNCDVYSSHEARKSRCKELKMCFLCSSIKHMSDKCLGKQNKFSFECSICKTKGHISALCEKCVKKRNDAPNTSNTSLNFCLNMGV